MARGLGAGLCIGFAVGSKVSVVPFALIVLMALILRTAYRKRTRILAAELGDPVGFRPASPAERNMHAALHFGRGLIYLAFAAIVSIIAFVISEPYVLLSFDYSLFSTGGIQGVLETSPFWRGITEQAAIQSGQAMCPIRASMSVLHLSCTIFNSLSSGVLARCPDSSSSQASSRASGGRYVENRPSF